jgi:acetylornithine deacetylase/succinyl-diaminopimelate desuccinylase-like protein
MQQVLDYINSHQSEFVEELKALLRIPSISADPKYLPDMKKCAEFVQAKLAELDLDAKIVPTAGHPIVYARSKHDPKKPTVLIYGHYDVQPPDPLDLWTTPPFEPTIRDGKIYARGATDDKGQFYTHVKSVSAWMKTVGSLPVNVIYVIEGEEEVGSNNLDLFLENHKDELKADIAIISDTPLYAPGIPAITCGLRGIVACEIKVTGPNRDLHSGAFGGSIMNPATGLARMVAKLHDDQGRIQIPRFYDEVTPLKPTEREEMNNLPFDEQAYYKDIGVTTGFGETGFSANERRWARPTCEINGMLSGYTGAGPKTIVPSWAMAKITCRLVPNQDPHKIVTSLKAFFEQNLPTGLTMAWTEYHGCPGIAFDFDEPPFKAASTAIETAFGKKPLFIREGGSIPVVATFKKILGVSTMLLGWGLNSENLHSPNEHFWLDHFHKGTLASASLWQELANLKK